MDNKSYKFQEWDGYNQGVEPSNTEKGIIIDTLIKVLLDSSLEFYEQMNICSGITIKSATPKIWKMTIASE